MSTFTFGTQSIHWYHYFCTFSQVNFWVHDFWQSISTLWYCYFYLSRQSEYFPQTHLAIDQSFAFILKAERFLFLSRLLILTQSLEFTVGFCLKEKMTDSGIIQSGARSGPLGGDDRGAWFVGKFGQMAPKQQDASLNSYMEEAQMSIQPHIQKPRQNNSQHF